MARELKVYGGMYDGLNRVIVAATTKKAAYEAMKTKIGNIGSYNTWEQYTSDSGNTEELDAAIPEPGCVFSKNHHEEKFRKL